MLETVRPHDYVLPQDGEHPAMRVTAYTASSPFTHAADAADYARVALAGADVAPVADSLASPVVAARPDVWRLAHDWAYPALKRGLDVVVAAMALLILAPLMLAVMIAIVRGSAGAPIFSQERCGRDGRVFRILKFRTMVTDAERLKAEIAHLNEVGGPMFKMRRDPRVTPIGYWLRRLSIDELPQLINVLRGDMTLVGPRPSLGHELAHFTPEQLERLQVKPGLTCLWQVSGRSDLPFDQWVDLDIEYVRTRSLWLDLRILVRTIPAVVSGRGAY